MNKKQIRRDYQNIDYVDEKGKVRTRVRYVGALYSPADWHAFGIFRVVYAVLVLLSIAAFVVPLCFNSQVFRTVYFTMPYVLMVFAVFVVAIAAYKLLLVRLPYREEDFAFVFKKAKAWCLVGGGLALLSVVAFAVYACLAGAVGTDYVALGCALWITLAFATLFALSVRQRFERTEHAAEAAAAPLPISAEDEHNATDDASI